jgi:glutathione S-transferase
VKSSGVVPFCQLPVLVVDGKLLCQSGSINRYLVSLVPDLVPKDPFEAAKVDSVFETAQELTPINPICNVFKGELFQEKKNDYFLNILPPRLGNINKLIMSSGGPFTCGESPYYCDFAVYHQFDLVREVEPSAFDSFPAVQAFLAAVESLPGVNEYLSTRPDIVDIGTAPMQRAKTSPGLHRK